MFKIYDKTILKTVSLTDAQTHTINKTKMRLYITHSEID